jgi:hypothetical protein
MAAKTKVSNANWKLIVEQACARKCVPFLGVAANVSVEGSYKGLPWAGRSPCGCWRT